MKTKQFLLLIFILVKANCNFAQVPGYMGKRLMIGVTANYSPAFSDVVFEDQVVGGDINFNGKTRNIFLNAPKIGTYIKWAISEHKMLEIGLAFQKSGITTAIPGTEHGGVIQPNSKLHAIDLAYARANYTTISIGLSKNTATAPIGAYFSYGLLILVNQVEAVDVKEKVYDLGTTFDLGFGGEFGYRRVIKDVIVLETGAGFSFYGRGFISFIPGIEATPEDKIVSRSLFNQYLNNICTLKAGVYYLL